VVSVSGQLLQGISPMTTEALMVAVMETQSAFSYSDANGHYVRVLAISSQCTTGAPGAGSCSTPGGAKKDSAAPAAAQPAPAAPRGTASDQQLGSPLMGSG